MAQAQNPQSLSGKLLRIEVIPPPQAPPPSPQYTIPWYNPYAGPGGPLDEIVSMGLRNPWRFSFDRENGDLYIGDVGQNNYEEIDYKSHRNLGAENFGWPRHEGMACPAPYCSSTCSPVTPRIDPIKSYGRSVGCAVTGGYVYRGCRMPDLRGRYFYGDFCSMIQSFVVSGGIVSDERTHTTELRPVNGTQISRVTSFGEDAQGEIYFTDYSGQVLKIVPLLRNLEVSGMGATMLHLDVVWTWENLSRSTSHPVDEYRVYRAEGRGDGIFTCIHRSTANRWPGGDPLVPHPGGVQSYIVTAVRRYPTVEESSPGLSSAGDPRMLSPASCPP
jgi:hypothetical protein